MATIFEEYFEQNSDTEADTSYADYTVHTEYTDYMG